VVASCDSQRTVFRRIALQSYAEWPAYGSTPLYDRSSLAGLEEDIWTVASTWFDHQAHHSVDEFVSHYPVAYVEFGPHDRYSGATQYEMAQLFRLFLLKEIHGWTHETALLTYLTHRPDLREQLNIETVPDQSTLWRSWHKRFTTELRETVEAAARTILIKAQDAGVTVPREPERNFPSQDDGADKSDPDDQAILSRSHRVRVSVCLERMCNQPKQTAK